VGERGQALPLGEVLDDDRALHHHAVGHPDEGAAGQEGVVEVDEGVGRRIGTPAYPLRRLGMGRQIGQDDTLGLQGLVQLRLHHHAVDADDASGPAGNLRRSRPTG
jgi:hypothetical protein